MMNDKDWSGGVKSEKHESEMEVDVENDVDGEGEKTAAQKLSDEEETKNDEKSNDVSRHT